MSERSLLILNGKSASRPDVRDAVKAVQEEADLDVRIPWSGEQTHGDLRRAIDEGTTRIIAGGGDGTLNFVSNALVQLELTDAVSFGFMPLGTANDFARGTGDAADNLEASLRRAATGEAVPTDLGTVNGQCFINVASGGFGAMVTATTPGDLKKSLGGLAYTLHGLSRLSEIRPQACRFEIDGSETLDAPLSFMAVGNSRYAGGGFDVSPKAQLDDGLLDLSFVSVDTTALPGRPMRELLDPTNSENEMLVYRTFRRCVMETDSEFHLNLDGEPMTADRFEFEVLPAALRMVR